VEQIVVVWLHLLAASVWLGAFLFVSHLVVPALARGERAYLGLLDRARVVAWAAIALLLVTGLDNLRRVRLDSPWLIGKLLLVLVLLALAAHRDFALVPRAIRMIARGGSAAVALGGLRWLDRVLLIIAVVVLFLGVGVARGR
jgi:putative copper export protein